MASPTAPHQDMISDRPINTATQSVADQPASSPVDASSPTLSEMGPEYHSPEFHPAHSHADIEQEAHALKPHIHRRRTNNYEQALSDHAAASGTQDHTNPSLAYRGNNPGADAPPAANVGRQQSFKMSDQKRAAMEQSLLVDHKTPGYSTTGK
jgi:hypothetical protein